MQINKYKNLGSGWFSESTRHHNAKVFGIAGGLYAKQLPIYKIGNKFYFRDARLGEYRDVINPHNKLSINTDNSKLQKSTWKEFQDYVAERKADVEVSKAEKRNNEVTGDLYAKKKDYIKGGIGDKTDISSLNQKELKKGIKVEMEHTSNPKIAREIASDHIAEFPKGYYENLAKMEENLKKINNNDNTLIVSRVTYGKQTTPFKDREYVSNKWGFPVGTRIEWEKFAKQKGFKVKFRELPKKMVFVNQPYKYKYVVLDSGKRKRLKEGENILYESPSNLFEELL